MLTDRRVGSDLCRRYLIIIGGLNKSSIFNMTSRRMWDVMPSHLNLLNIWTLSLIYVSGSRTLLRHFQRKLKRPTISSSRGQRRFCHDKMITPGRIYDVPLLSTLHLFCWSWMERAYICIRVCMCVCACVCVSIGRCV